jgi:hypothetical protein
MSTRALAKVYNEDGKILVTIYKHWDGYPDGFGADLEKFAAQFTLVNGLNSGQPEIVANGMGCFAAFLVQYLKKEAGDVYIYPPEASDCWEEYIYHIKPDRGKITVICESVYGDEDE